MLSFRFISCDCAAPQDMRLELTRCYRLTQKRLTHLRDRTLLNECRAAFFYPDFPADKKRASLSRPYSWRSRTSLFWTSRRTTWTLSPLGRCLIRHDPRHCNSSRAQPAPLRCHDFSEYNRSSLIFYDGWEGWSV